MTYKSKVFNKITAIVSLVFGVIYCITLIGLPIGMFCFISYRRFQGYSELSDTSLISFKPIFKKWAIFISIFAFPLGLISLIPLIFMGNNAKVSNAENPSTFTFKPEEPKVSTEAIVQENEKREQSKNTLTDEETIAKLKELLDLGLISREEYERAKSEVIKKG